MIFLLKLHQSDYQEQVKPTKANVAEPIYPLYRIDQYSQTSSLSFPNNNCSLIEMVWE